MHALHMAGRTALTAGPFCCLRRGSRQSGCDFIVWQIGAGIGAFRSRRLGKKARLGLVSEGDLLYFTVAERAGEKQILLFNLTHHFPSEEQLRQQLGEDRTLRCLRKLLPQLRRIRAGGYYDNSKGPGKIAPKDVGDTLEGLLGNQTNNKTQADYKGEIEIKAKKGRTMDTLFTLRPEFEGTPIASYEPEDEKRVSPLHGITGITPISIPAAGAFTSRWDQSSRRKMDEGSTSRSTRRRTGWSCAGERAQRRM